jgi:tetratricopeptide (TPR) repeat protein
LAFAANDEALAWYDSEWANLVAATRQAAAADLNEIAWRLPPTLFPLFNRRGNWADCVTTNRIAADIAAKAGEPLGEAWALQQLGFALVRLRDPEAFGHLERALAVRQEFGDARGEAQTAIALGDGYLKMHGAGEDALRYMQRAVALLEPMGASSLRSAALIGLGEVYRELDDLDAAAESYLQALEIGREFGGLSEGFALFNLGLVYVRQRRLDEAIARFEEALPRHRASGARDGEALTLQGLGSAQAETGRRAAARSSLTEALRIFEQMGYRDEAAETAALLASLVTEDGQR